VLDSSGRLIDQLDIDEARSLIAAGVAVGGMAAKLEAAHAALAGGVGSVRIADLGALGNPKRGTFIMLATVGAK
jgi:acetylglutamate kinase